MTSEPRVNCQRGGKGLVRVGLSDKGVGTSTLSLSLFLSLFRYLLLSLPISFIPIIILSLSPFPATSSRALRLVRVLFFFPLFAFLISFSSVVGSERARVLSRGSAETMVCLAAN